MATMTTPPTASRRNARLLAALKGVDLAIGSLGIIGGLWVLVFPPSSFIQNVTVPVLLLVWGGFLLVGGIGALVGRLTDLWLVECVGIVALFIGCLIYAITIITAATLTLTSSVGVAVAVFLIAALAMAHRYIELQRLTGDPHPLDGGFWQRLRAVIFRRTLAPR